ncbi:MAG: methyltransferase domain-containing protein [Armatimonadetes bacterium]|nr:methyltransferase domain-containing protein [Armatimonadota bacterium]
MSVPTHTYDSLIPIGIEVVEEGDVALILSATKVSGLVEQVMSRLGESGLALAVGPNPSQFSSCCAGTEGENGSQLKVLQGSFTDLALNLTDMEARLAQSPPKTLAELRDLEQATEDQRLSDPLLHSASVDSVIAVGVLRSVAVEDRMGVLSEIYRVLKKGGTLALLEIVSDEPMSDRLLRNSDTPGVFQELELLEAVEDAKFHGISLSHLDHGPMDSIEGTDFRRILLKAHKGKEGMCVERYQGVIYRGPWKLVEDDDGHVLKRGQRFAVCDKTFNIYKKPPYAGQFLYLEPEVEVPFDQAKPWDVRHPAERPPSETKGTSIARVSSAAPYAPGNDGGQTFIAIVEWRKPDGSLSRRAKVAHRYRGYFESETEALDTARKAFPDASRYNAVAVSLEELAARSQRAGRALACPVPVASHN